MVSQELKERVKAALESDPGMAEDLEARRVDPYRAADMLVERVNGGGVRG